MAIQATFVIFAIGFAMMGWFKLQEAMIEQDWTERSASHLAQVTQAVGGRMFEMGSQFVLNPAYSSGTPPGAAGSLSWLKNPAACAITGLPPLPNDEAGSPVDESFVPCDFSDTNIWGSTYTVTWNTVYPGTRTVIQVGTVPFTVNGVRRDDIAGDIAVKASKHSLAGLGDSTLDVMINYNFDPATGSLTAVIDRSAPFAADPHLRIDGSNMMDAAAPIRWANNMEIRPNSDAMEITAPGGISLFDDTTINGNLTVDESVTMNEGIVKGVQIAGSYDARLSRAVYDQRMNRSGDIVEKPVCATGTPQIFVAAASMPVGDGMLIQTHTGSSMSGNISRFRTSADDLGTQWQVWGEVYIGSSWVRLGAVEGDLRSSIKCT